MKHDDPRVDDSQYHPPSAEPLATAASNQPESSKRLRFPNGMNPGDHAPTCDIETTRDGWDAECTCGLWPA